MKYKLTDETIEVDGRILHRIECVEAFGGVCGVAVGEKGGYIESEYNLSQEGKAWITGNAKVYDKARIYDDAHVYGNAVVRGEAEVFGKAAVYGNAEVCENAIIDGAASVCGDAIVYGDAKVSGGAEIRGDACIGGDALISGMTGIAQGTTTAMHIRKTEQFYEYQHVIAELQKKWDKEEKEEEE